MRFQKIQNLRNHYQKRKMVSAPIWKKWLNRNSFVKTTQFRRHFYHRFFDSSILRFAVVCFLCMMNPTFAQMNFTDVTAASGIDYQNFSETVMGSGAAFFDFDNDGYLDLYLLNNGNNKVNTLYHNNGDGTFLDVTALSGVGDAGEGMGVDAADYDNDGFMDFYVTNYGANVLYHNNGDGTFENVTDLAGVGDTLNGANPLFIDVDADGDLDLYVGNYSGNSDVMYQNNGDGTFTDVTDVAGIGGARSTMGLAYFDFDFDGDLDIYAAMDFRNDFLFENDGKGVFTNLIPDTATTGLGVKKYTMSPALGDFDNDGDFDIYTTTAYSSNALYRNDGDLGQSSSFTNVARAAGVANQYFGWGSAFCDFDNDGWLDIYVATGYFGSATPDALYRNSGDTVPGQVGVFTDVAPTAGLIHNKIGRGVAFGDFDNDGDTDIFIVNYQQQGILYRNDSPGGNWLTLKLNGSTSSRDGKGALVKLKTEGKMQIRQAGGMGGYLSCNDPRIKFGLGAIETVDTLVIHWLSGIVDTLNNLPVNQFLTIQENETTVSVRDGAQPDLFPKNPALLQNYPNPFNPSTTIQYKLANRTPVLLQIFNLSGQFITTLVNGKQNPGIYAATWNGVDSKGKAISSGIYFYRLQTGEFSFTRKMLLLQ